MSNKVPQIRFNGYSDVWEERKLGELANIVRGASPRPIQDPKWFDKDSDIGWLRISDVTEQDGRIRHLEQRISKLGQEKTRVLMEPHLLLSIAATVGKPLVNYVKTGVHDGFLIFLNPVFDREFMFQWLDMFRPKWKKYGQPGSQVNLNSELVRNQEIDLPRIEEQQQIGSFFKQLDDIIALQQRKLDLLKEQKKGYLQKMFPKNGAKVPELRFAGFSEDWKERKFKDILKTYSFRSYLANASDHGKYEVIQQGDNPLVGYSDGIPFMNYKDIILFGDHTVSLYKPQSPFFISTDGVKILSADNFEGNYLYTTLERYKPDSQGYKRHFTILKNQELWFTRNVEEQQKVGSFFKQLDNNIALQQKKISLLKDQKKGLLQKMFI